MTELEKLKVRRERWKRLTGGPAWLMMGREQAIRDLDRLIRRQERRDAGEEGPDA